MTRLSFRCWLIPLLLGPTCALALEVGEIQVQSALNQLFDATIPLPTLTPEELGRVSVKIASPPMFEEFGLDRTATLANLVFSIQYDAEGRVYVKVVSTQPIREPSLALLLEFGWPRGKTFREFTVLLDPVRRLAQRPGSRTKTVLNTPEAPAATPSPTTAAAEPPRPAVAPSTAPAYKPGDVYGPVAPGEGLWGIALKLRPEGITREQMMQALFQANPQAFSSAGIGGLKTGARLRIPTYQEIADATGSPIARRLATLEEHPTPPTIADGAPPPGAPEVFPLAPPTIPEPVAVTETPAPQPTAPTPPEAAPSPPAPVVEPTAARTEPEPVAQPPQPAEPVAAAPEKPAAPEPQPPQPAEPAVAAAPEPPAPAPEPPAPAPEPPAPEPPAPEPQTPQAAEPVAAAPVPKVPQAAEPVAAAPVPKVPQAAEPVATAPEKPAAPEPQPLQAAEPVAAAPEPEVSQAAEPVATAPEKPSAPAADSPAMEPVSATPLLFIVVSEILADAARLPMIVASEPAASESSVAEPLMPVVAETPAEPPAPVIAEPPPTIEQPSPAELPDTAITQPARVYKGGDEYGPVSNNERLWDIATKVRPDPEMGRDIMMKALFLANPQSFSKPTMDHLKAGSMLRIPTLQEIVKYTDSTVARSLLEQQNQQAAESRKADVPKPASPNENTPTPR